MFEALISHCGVWGSAAIDAPQIRAHCSAGGASRAFVQAIGTSRCRRPCKLHGLTGERGRPLALMVAAGNINDMTMAQALHDVDQRPASCPTRPEEACRPCGCPLPEKWQITALD